MLFLTEHQKFDSSKGARQNKKSIIYQLAKSISINYNLQDQNLLYWLY